MFEKYYFLLMGIIFTTYGIIFYYFLRYLHIRNVKVEEEFHKLMLEGLKNETIEDLEDVYIIYNGLKRTQISNGDYRLNHLLNTFIKKLQSNKDSLEVGKLKVYIKKAKELLNKNKEVEPFSDLPDQEKNILNDILSYVQSKDSDSAIRKLKELAIAVSKQKLYVNKLEKQNKWSIPLAIIGLILTVIFGVLSLN